MIGVQEVPDPHSVDLAEAGLMLPVPGLQTNSIHLEPRDGSNVETLTAQAVTLQRNGKTILRCRNIRITVFITDARVALACSKYDKGGGWIGSPTAMVMANTVSKGLAAIRRHGKMLVGQVRYQWVSGVGSTARLGVGSNESLVLEAKTDAATTLRLTLLLPRNIDAAAIAAEVVSRAARYRLSAEPNVADDKRIALGQLVNVRPLPTGVKNIIQFHRTPNFYFMNLRSAKIAPAGVGSGSRIALSPPSDPQGVAPTALSPEAAEVVQPDEPPSQTGSRSESMAASGAASRSARSEGPGPATTQPIVITLDDL